MRKDREVYGQRYRADNRKMGGYRVLLPYSRKEQYQ